MRLDRPRDLARRIALVIFDGSIDEAALRERLMRAFRPITPWLIEMALRLLDESRQTAVSDQDAWTERILAHPAFQKATRARDLPRLARITPIASPTPPARLQVPGLPVIESPQALAEWLRVAPGELVWFADAWGQEARRADGPLRHYRYRWRAREYGPDRLIEMPKRSLRQIQRRLHTELLGRVPLHDAAHGFVRARSALTHARLHVGRDWVLRVDLEQFFASITAVRVRGVFDMLGYPPAVARALAALCTNRVPTEVLQTAPHGPLSWANQQRHRQPHLPQGAPSSPVLANIVAWRLDARLAGWAARRGLTYSRYADDLTFSGDALSRRGVLQCTHIVAAIAEDCGFRVNHRKTCHFGGHQAQRVTGVVVNRHPNIARHDFDRLKAILTRCVRHGPAGENRDGHADFRAWLRGRLAWCASVNPARAIKLERLFAQIVWD